MSCYYFVCFMEREIYDISNDMSGVLNTTQMGQNIFLKVDKMGDKMYNELVEIIL